MGYVRRESRWLGVVLRRLGRMIARRRSLAVLALELLLLSVLSPSGGVAVALGASTSPTTTVGEAFAHQVLDQAFLPPGSHPTTEISTAINHFFPSDIALPSGTPESASAFFVTSLSPAAAAAAIERHYPHRAFATTNGPPPQGITAVALLPKLSGPNDEGAEVIYSICADSTGSELRVKATVIWAPDRPLTESVPSTGPVTVTGYTKGSLDQGATDPVTVRVLGQAASQLRRTFNALYRAASPPECMENIASFRLAFPRRTTQSQRPHSAVGGRSSS